jgi:hypothetical protein
VAETETFDQPTTAALANQSLANSVAIAVSDATTALRNVQAIMTTVQSVAMARWLDSGERDEAAQQIVQTATQITRDAVRLWQEVQATAQALIDGRENAVDAREPRNPSAETKPVPRKVTKKSARKPGKATAAKKAARKPAKPAPAAKKAPAKKAKPAKGPAKPRKPRAAKPKPAPAPPADVAPPSDEG